MIIALWCAIIVPFIVNIFFIISHGQLEESDRLTKRIDSLFRVFEDLKSDHKWLRSRYENLEDKAAFKDHKEYKFLLDSHKEDYKEFLKEQEKLRSKDTLERIENDFGDKKHDC